ncbi:hypothetical protein D3C72_1111860 [compost metagenome]
MLATVTPSALAFSRSMSICSCGASSWPSGRTPISTGLCAAMPSIMLRASISLAWPWPVRSCRRKSKPEELPSSEIAGGLSGKMIASLMNDSAPKARPTSACAVSPSPVRSFQSFRRTNAIPPFWPRPKKEKPATVIIWSTTLLSFCR